MPIELTSFDQLDETEVQTRLERLTSIIEDQGAGIEVRRGAFHDLVLRMQAVFGQAYSDAVDTLVNSTNPILALQNTGAIDSSLLTAAAAAQGVTRANGSEAAGTITIVVSQNRAVMIPSGTQFTTSDGRIFITGQVFAVRSVGSVAEDLSNRILIERSDGNYEFSVPVTSQSEGLSGNIVKGTELSLVNGSITNFVTAYAASDFSGGNNTETDTQLLARMTQTIPASSLSTRASVASVIRQFDFVSELYAVSTIGYGDAELQRGTNLIARTGKADTYVRTAALPSIVDVEVTGTVVDIVDGGHATWQFAIDRDAAPGFYNVASVTDASGGTYSNISLERGFDASPLQGELIPELTTATDAAFSRFSTATVRCTTPSGTYSLGDTQTLIASMRVMPLIEELQTMLGSRSYRFVGGDLLVRAAIPTFVSVNVQVYRRPGVELSNPESLRTSIANEFNLAGFSTIVHGSRIATIANNFLPPGAAVNRVDMFAETLRPDGTLGRKRSADNVMIETDNLVSLSGRTSIFICDPNDVSITAYEEAVPQVV